MITKVHLQEQATEILLIMLLMTFLVSLFYCCTSDRHKCFSLRLFQLCFAYQKSHLEQLHILLIFHQTLKQVDQSTTWLITVGLSANCLVNITTLLRYSKFQYVYMNIVINQSATIIIASMFSVTSS